MTRVYLFHKNIVGCFESEAFSGSVIESAEAPPLSTDDRALVDIIFDELLPNLMEISSKGVTKNIHNQNFITV